MELLNDFQTSVRKAFDEIDPGWESYPGLVVCGTHSPKLQEIERAIEKIREAREKKLPFLGICFGLQLAVIEYARSVLGILGATSEEWEFGSPNSVIVKMPNLRVGIKNIRGNYESFWHNYKVIPSLREALSRDFTIGGETKEYIDIIMGSYESRFVAVQFHPEYQSSKDKPHPLLNLFLLTCKTYGSAAGRQP